MTNSEQLFDDYCNAEEIASLKIPGKHGRKTADRQLDIGDEVIVVEVKELDYDPRGIETKNGIKTRMLSSQTVEIGKKARQKILEGNKQIKSSMLDVGGPSYGLLVLYADHENEMDHHFDPGCVADAMYGDSKIVLTVVNGIPDRSLDEFERSGRERMTSTSNTSIGAVAVLSKRWPWPEEKGKAPECGYFLKLDVYHNKYAARSLPPSLLNNENTTHYEYNDSSGYWEPMGGVAEPTTE